MLHQIQKKTCPIEPINHTSQLKDSRKGLTSVVVISNDITLSRQATVEEFTDGLWKGMRFQKFSSGKKLLSLIKIRSRLLSEISRISNISFTKLP